MKWFSMFLIPFFLMNAIGIQVGDVLQLGELREHAVLHKQKYGDDLLTFLSKHYGKERLAHENDPEHGSDEHESLPFKHISCQAGVSLIFAHEMPIFKTSLQTVIHKSNISYVVELRLLAYIEALFQPPQSIV